MRKNSANDPSEQPNMSGLKKADSLTGARTARFAKSAIYGMVGQIVALAAPLVMMPLMFNYLGEARFGLWVSCVSATSILVFFDLGTGNALTTRLSRAFSECDLSGAREMIAGALKIYAVIFLLGTGLGVVCLGALVLYFEEESYFFVGLPVVLFFFANFPAGIIYRIYHAKQRILSYNFLLVVSVLVAASVSYFAISLGAPYWLTVSLFSGLPVLIAFVALYFEIAASFDLRTLLNSVAAVETKGLLELGSKFFVLSILTNVGMNSDILVISIVLGQEAAANSAIPIKIGSVLLSLVGFAFMPLWSMHAELLAREDYESIFKISSVAGLLGSLVVLISGLVLVYFGNDIVRIWMGATFPNQCNILLAMTVLTCVVAVTAPYNMILNAQGLAAIQILPWLAFVVISLLAKFVFLSPGNAWFAPAFSAAAYAVFVMPFMVYYARRSLRVG